MDNWTVESIEPYVAPLNDGVARLVTPNVTLTMTGTPHRVRVFAGKDHWSMWDQVTVDDEQRCELITAALVTAQRVLGERPRLGMQMCWADTRDPDVSFEATKHEAVSFYSKLGFSVSRSDDQLLILTMPIERLPLN